jgi:hypothetical protein
VKAPRSARLVPAIAVACVLLVYLVQRHRIDLRFPVPWPDEGSFLWQALAFRDGFSLFAPEVNPEREALWMPPGFMVLEGLFFKVVPFSLSTARALSALFVCGAVTSVFACVRRFETKLLFPVLAALCLFCPIASMAGNVARMEGLELFTLALAFFLVDRGRGAALGVFALAPIVHPNGVFGIAVGVPAFFVLTRGVRTMRRADWVVLAAAVLAWALYAFHVSQHWPDFLRDMDAQLRFKQYVSGSDGGTLGRLRQPVVWGSIVALAGAFLGARRIGTAIGAIGAFAAALLLQTVVAAGWLYEVYPAFAILVTSVVVADVAFSWHAAQPSASRTRCGVAFAVVLVLADVLAFRHDAFLERSLERATVVRKSLTPEYVTDGDQLAMKRYLASIVPPAGSRALAVQFLPDAEALLYEKLRGPTLRYVQQTFYEHRYDVLVVHDSVWFPPFVHNLELIKLLWAKGGTYDTTVLYERDGTERWTAYRWK